MKLCFLLLLPLVLSLSAFAQSDNVKAAIIANPPSMEDLEVKDSAGNILATDTWKKMFMTGKYRLHTAADHKTTIIYKLSEADINRKFEAMPKPKESVYFKTGEKIISFRESDMNGNKFSLKDLTGKIVVLNFWFINCPPCRIEIPSFNDLAEKYQNNKEVVFIAVALDEKREIIDFLKTNPFTFHIIDGGRYIANIYKITSYPTSVVLDKQGKVLFHTSDTYPNTAYWIDKSIQAGLEGSKL